MGQRNYDHDVHQIRSALQHSSGSRASLMVGSGFSFNSKRRFSSARDFPSWKALTESLVEKLYPENRNDRERALLNAGATSGALRIAQEFEAAFGKTVLKNHIRDIIPDCDHDPGPLHEELLKLAWADVFTTNYDTLLERVARTLRDQRYEIVRCTSDLPLKRGPRLVKLHGTLPELSDCILTEEDYRTYPEKFAPFVADVQVSIVKTHMCLAGFSGDDPNFLAWSGWVRDRLGSQTLPIYLWLFDEPTMFQARLLEQRSIIPLPLRVITGVDDHQGAISKFLKLLNQPIRKSAPRWCLPRRLTNENISKEPTAALDHTNSWIEAALRWNNERHLYPGWILPHCKALESLWESTEKWANGAGAKAFAKLEFEPPVAIFILSELVWRMQTSAFPLYDDIATSIIPQALQKFSDWQKSQEVSSIAVNGGISCTSLTLTINTLKRLAVTLRCEVLRHARETGDFDRFDTTLKELQSSIESLQLPQESDEYHFAMHQRALACLSTWNDDQLRKILREWQTDSSPIWAVRRAGLLIELGESVAGKALLQSAIHDLRSIADEGTPETWSMETWAIFQLQSLDRVAGISEPTEKMFERTITGANVTEESRFLPYRIPEYNIPENSDDAEHSRRENFEDVLNWLANHDCDPRESYEWLDVGNRLEFVPPGHKTRRKEFDSRRWTETWHSGGAGSEERFVAAYRTLRVIEETGQSLRSDSVNLFSFSLAESSVKYLAKHDAKEVTGAVLRLRSKKAIEDWFTRRRIATLSKPEIDRLVAMAEDHIKSFIELSSPTQIASPEQVRIEASLCLLSHLVVRLDDAQVARILDLAISLPTELHIDKNWQLADDISHLVSRTCECLSSYAFQEQLANLTRLPVPGLDNFPSLRTTAKWSDPVCHADRRNSASYRTSPELDDSVDWCLDHLAKVSASSSGDHARRHLVLRLVTLVNCDVIDEARKIRIANALYLRSDAKTGFPVETGCYDGVVLFLPQIPAVNEPELFLTKYVRTPWPTGGQELLDHLSSLALTGKPPQSHSRGSPRRRHVTWTDGDIESIARSCSRILSGYANQTSELAEESSAHPFRRMTPDWKRLIVHAVAEVYDEVVLSGEVIPRSAWDIVVKSVQEAVEAQLPVLRVFPRMLSFQAEETSLLKRDFIDNLSGMLASTRDETFKDGLSWLNHWANLLDDSRIPRIPSTLLSIVVSRLKSPYSRVSIDIVDTVRNLIRRLPHGQCSTFYKQCEPSIASWSKRLKYSSKPSSKPSDLTEELPDLRAALTKLCVIARDRGIKAEIVELWIKEVRDDQMSEIRRNLSKLADDMNDTQA